MNSHQKKVKQCLALKSRTCQTYYINSAFCCSVTKSCPILCIPIDCSTPGFLVLYHLLEFSQTHVHWVSDPIQLSHLLPSSDLNLPQHQGLFQWVTSLHQVAQVLGASASVLPMNTQDWFPLGLTGLTCCPRDSRISSTTIQKHQFFRTQPSLWFNSWHLYMTTGKMIALTLQMV